MIFYTIYYIIYNATLLKAIYNNLNFEMINASILYEKNSKCKYVFILLDLTVYSFCNAYIPA